MRDVKRCQTRRKGSDTRKQGSDPPGLTRFREPWRLVVRKVSDPEGPTLVRDVTAGGCAGWRGAAWGGRASAPPRPGARTGGGAPRSDTVYGSRSTRRDAPRRRAVPRRSARGPCMAASTARSLRNYSSALTSDCGVRHCLFQDTPPAVQARHDRADRDVEDLRCIGVREVADVDEDDDVAKVMRPPRQRIDHVVLRQPLHDAVLVARAAAARRLLELVVEE